VCFVRAGGVRVVCGIYVIYARCLRVSVQSAHFSTTEVAYRIALLFFRFASPLSRRLHHIFLILIDGLAQVLMHGTSRLCWMEKSKRAIR